MKYIAIKMAVRILHGCVWTSTHPNAELLLWLAVRRVLTFTRVYGIRGVDTPFPSCNHHSHTPLHSLYSHPLVFYHWHFSHIYIYLFLYFTAFVQCWHGSRFPFGSIFIWYYALLQCKAIHYRYMYACVCMHCACSLRASNSTKWQHYKYCLRI